MTTNQSNRIYRPVDSSDYPAIKSGKLKAFFGVERTPCELISERMYRSEDNGYSVGAAWLVHAKDFDFICTSAAVRVDITPEKRYVIWSKKAQRFTVFSVADWYNTEPEAWAAIADFCKITTLKESDYSVVPFDYPGEAE